MTRASESDPYYADMNANLSFRQGVSPFLSACIGILDQPAWNLLSCWINLGQGVYFDIYVVSFLYTLGVLLDQLLKFVQF